MNKNPEESFFESWFMTSETTSGGRFDICKKCPFLTKRNRCKKCGCFMKLKTKLSLAKCPIGKW
tara:strand:- start:954 stop:1145 length:192 start_codon:yes stop_codon:yes gene_type:complete